MTQAPVLTRIADEVGIVTLNRPDRLNAWDGPMRQQVKEAIERLDADPAVRAIVLTGAGDKAFSAGQDLNETEKFTGGEDGRAWFNSWRDFYDSLRRASKPCVAALNGVAAGSAFQFAMLCDVRVGHAGTRMGQPEINAGIPSVLGPMLMIERLGLSRAIELTLSGRMMGAAECRQIGLIHHLAPRRQVLKKAIAVARELAAKPPNAMRLNRQRFREVTQPAFDEAFQNGQRIQYEAYASGEPQAAMARFFAEREARQEAKQARGKAKAKAKPAPRARRGGAGRRKGR
ncbi:MAG: enoyl-CoA hydratase/isomerase family protein [Alphaproteobacteria bacterium]|nr:enoyl-CoA hydratase/isomerase family protein [Alphaproteobacteria bacterium]